VCAGTRCRSGLATDKDFGVSGPVPKEAVGGLCRQGGADLRLELPSALAVADHGGGSMNVETGRSGNRGGSPCRVEEAHVGEIRALDPGRRPQRARGVAVCPGRCDRTACSRANGDQDSLFGPPPLPARWRAPQSMSAQDHGAPDLASGAWDPRWEALEPSVHFHIEARCCCHIRVGSLCRASFSRLGGPRDKGYSECADGHHDGCPDDICVLSTCRGENRRDRAHQPE
jgi:hypothetical protein